MRGIAIEQWPARQTSEVLNWLDSNYGPSSDDTWYLDQDFNLFTLCMSDEIYFIFKLKW
jgi:hypothetical protein